LIYDFDAVMDKYEKKKEIHYIRKDLLKNVQGYILESCVGTSRNIKYYLLNYLISF